MYIDLAGPSNQNLALINGPSFLKGFLGSQFEYRNIDSLYIYVGTLSGENEFLKLRFTVASKTKRLAFGMNKSLRQSELGNKNLKNNIVYYLKNDSQPASFARVPICLLTAAAIFI